MKNNTSQMPLKSFQCGQIRASIWLNAKEIDHKIVDVYRVTISKRYLDADCWKMTHSLRVDDLPKVICVATEAYRHLRVKAVDPRSTEAPPDAPSNGEDS